MKTVYLSLGSNIGDREKALQEAVNLLHTRDFRVRRTSSIYETEPMEVGGQLWFLNLVLEAETEIFPMQLLARIGRIEKQLGRLRTVDKGPRTIDIDILLFGRFVIDTPSLVVPHPRMQARRFVMEPLVELAPEIRHPVLRYTMRELLPLSKGQVARKGDCALVVPPL